MILVGDCLDKLKELEDNSVDSCVTDPPYELGFMGKKWDGSGIANNVDMWREVLRVLKPGGHLLSFSGTRTYHRQAVAIEDAGFEIRDMVEWVYSTGFPKSLNIGKAVDKLQGNERESLGIVKGAGAGMSDNLVAINKGLQPEYENTKGTSEWEGWGTALKPAHEPICLARKPIEGTVANNVLKYGTGGLNIDKSRVGMTQDDVDMLEAKSSKEFVGVKPFGNSDIKGSALKPNTQGRFPANLLHDGSDEVVGEFPNESERFFKSFLYCPKASKSERDRGCEGMDNKETHRFGAGIGEGLDPNAPSIGKNNHPTVKPLALMKYLIQMITPPGGTVLDPFAGSGSTLVAAKELGYDFIGIEMTEEYIPIIEARLNAVKETLL
jgi:DNA modification methylase